MTILYNSLQVPLLTHQQIIQLMMMKNMMQTQPESTLNLLNLGFAKWIGVCPIPDETFLDAATERIYHNFLAKRMM